MVLGHGLVAKAFSAYKDNSDYLVFASGVSNSANTDAEAFKREKDLLKESMERHPGKTLVYFSTCSMYDLSLKDSPYVQHKLKMEEIISDRQWQYHIFRVSNLVGKTGNRHTLLNFFAQHILSGASFFVWEDAWRNVIDIDDAIPACDYMIRHHLHLNETINVANPQNYSVIRIVQTLEEVLRRKGNYILIDKKNDFPIDTSHIEKIYAKLHIRFDETYLIRVLKKYYAAK